MGIKTSVAALLVRAKEGGASFSRTATIGRQSITVPLADLSRLAHRLGIPQPHWPQFAADGYCEDFFRLLLGADGVTSFDASGYQQATVVHDLNEPVPEQYHRAFDAVFDGGTIEHVFDIKQVLSNYMTLTKVGGHLYICTNANNLCGHGFYQFSPEFFYRVFSEANGFCVETLCLIETPFHLVEKSARQRVLEVADPVSVGKRMVIVNNRPVSIYVHARRIEERPLFAHPPHQSDYRARWSEQAASSLPAKASNDSASTYRFEYLSRSATLRRALLQKRKNSLRNRRWFKRLVP